MGLQSNCLIWLIIGFATSGLSGLSRPVPDNVDESRNAKAGLVNYIHQTVVVQGDTSLCVTFTRIPVSDVRLRWRRLALGGAACVQQAVEERRVAFGLLTFFGESAGVIHMWRIPFGGDDGGAEWRCMSWGWNWNQRPSKFMHPCFWDEEADRGNDGKTTSKSGLALNGTSYYGKPRTARSGGSWL